MTRGKNARERHHEKQLMRVLSHALASKLRNLLSFGYGIRPDGGHEIVIRLRDFHWVDYRQVVSRNRSRAARNRKRR